MHFDLWTFALQAINVVVLVWLLARFLFRPVAGIVAARRAAANALLADAEATRAKAQAEAAALAKQRRELTADGESITAAARASAEAERATIVHQAESAAAKLRDDAEQAIAREQQVGHEAFEREASDLALTIAMRLLERLPVRVLNQAFLEGIAEVLATHPARASLTGAPVEVRSAAPLEPTTQAECEAMLTRLIGPVYELTFRTDPALIAGIELAFSDVLIRNSWQADLERIRSRLHEDFGHDVASQRLA
jgi:F-type H+-transporting ATPase subunit b